MARRTIWYDQADVNKGIVLWLLVFLLVAGGTLAAAADKPVASVPVLSHIDMLLLIPYWIACCIYTIILFAALKYGRTWSPYPLFVGLQVAIALLECGTGIVSSIAETWKGDRYLMAPFFYSAVVYLVTLYLRKRVRLYDEAAWRKEKEEEV
jgi:hypothetical protein